MRRWQQLHQQHLGATRRLVLMLHSVPRARHWWGLFKEASIYQNRAERAMQRGEYLAAIDECQMGKARILKRNKKVSP